MTADQPMSAEELSDGIAAEIADMLRPWEAAIRAEATAKERERLLNTPELVDFTRAVIIEAQHQRERWGESHDAAKEPHDWFWTLGYLGGKALWAHIDGNTDKACHHAITTAALCYNWHAAIRGTQ